MTEVAMSIPSGGIYAIKARAASGDMYSARSISTSL